MPSDATVGRAGQRFRCMSLGQDEDVRICALAVRGPGGELNMLCCLTHNTVTHRGIGTSISEASKRVPIFSFATQGGKQASSYLFSTEELGPSPRSSDPVACSLSLIV